MADVIVVMRDGVLEQMGSPLELYDRPANKFVASFIGSPSMNFLDGTIERSGAGYRFRSDNGMTLPVDDKYGALAGQALALGVRPEHFQLEAEAFDGAVPVTVSVVEPTGSEAAFVLRSGQDEVIAVKRGRNDYALGSTVWIKPENGTMHFFGADEMAITY